MAPVNQTFLLPVDFPAIFGEKYACYVKIPSYSRRYCFCMLRRPDGDGAHGA
ncbi:hypothetical protein JXA32_00865 [Candidatus Sumerlaeota bacterium]|nr:hypothetical protein [Candidatus Sumerlaeota bacterium]